MVKGACDSLSSPRKRTNWAAALKGQAPARVVRGQPAEGENGVEETGKNGGWVIDEIGGVTSHKK